MEHIGRYQLDRPTSGITRFRVEAVEIGHTDRRTDIAELISVTFRCERFKTRRKEKRKDRKKEREKEKRARAFASVLAWAAV